MAAFSSIAAGIGAAGALASGAGSLMAGNEAGDAMDAQAAIAAEQARIAREQWDRYLKLYGPMEEGLIRESAMTARESPEFARLQAQMLGRQGTARAEAQGALAARYGQGGGLVGNLALRGMDRRNTADLYGAESDWNNNRFQKQYNLLSLGRGLPASSQAGLASAGNTYGNIGNYWGNQSAGLGNALGSIGQNLTQYYMLRNLMGNQTGGGGAPASM